MSSGLFNSSEPVRTIVQHGNPKPAVELDRRLELWFDQLRKSWTTPNSLEIVLWSLFPLELMRNYPMILVPSRAQWRKSWTTPSKPRRTSELQREQGSYDNFSLVRGCSTIMNMFEQQFNTGNQACSWTWHDFRVVQLFRTCSNHWALEWTRITG